MSADDTETGSGLTYRDAGVDIDAGNDLVDRIRPAVDRTRRPEVRGGLGGFGALVDLPAGYRDPVLVAGTDGVGTKLALAERLGRHDTIGRDLVAMCVNDLIVQGAEPLFFLDYFASGALDVGTGLDVLAGISAGCKQADCALIRYESARDPEGACNIALFDPAAFAQHRPTALPTWHLEANAHGVRAIADFRGDRVSFPRAAFDADPRLAPLHAF